jgi:hypothetical protein
MGSARGNKKNMNDEEKEKSSVTIEVSLTDAF